jgi:protein subunit release factor B
VALEVDPARRAAARRALALDEATLLSECELTFFIGSGPGGQHRNKSETAVRLSHPPTGITVTATERRSQPQNRAAALERLRERLAALSHVPKERRPTKPTRGAKERRLGAKRKASRKKAERRRGDDW